MVFKNWIIFAEEIYNKEIDTIEDFETEIKLASINLEKKGRSDKFYAILVGLSEESISQIVEGRNGYEVWRQFSLQMAPKTRSRSIAFLNHPNFTKDKGITMLEQLLDLERLVE